MISGTSAEAFIKKPLKSSDDNPQSPFTKFQKLLAKKLNAAEENVQIISVQDVEGGFTDVRYSVHGSPYYPPAQSDSAVILNKAEVSSHYQPCWLYWSQLYIQYLSLSLYRLHLQCLCVTSSLHHLCIVVSVCHCPCIGCTSNVCVTSSLHHLCIVVSVCHCPCIGCTCNVCVWHRPCAIYVLLSVSVTVLV